MLLTVEIGSGKEVLDSLKEMPDVKEVHQLYGVYDIIIHVEAETKEELKDLISNRIKCMRKIKSTMIMICIKEGDVQVDIEKRA